MSVYFRVRVLGEQECKQDNERPFLRFCARVFGFACLRILSAHVANAYTLRVVPCAMCSGYCNVTTCFYFAVEVNDIVVSYISQAVAVDMPAANISGAIVASCRCVAAMYDYFSYLSVHRRHLLSLQSYCRAERLQSFRLLLRARISLTQCQR